MLKFFNTMAASKFLIPGLNDSEGGMDMIRQLCCANSRVDFNCI